MRVHPCLPGSGLTAHPNRCICTFMTSQAPDPRSPSSCTCSLIRRVSRAVTRDFEASLKPASINVGQFTLLSTLSGCEGLPVAELAKRLDLDRTTLSRNLGPLQRDGLIEEVATKDNRVRLIALTKQGREVQAVAKQHWAGAQRRYVEQLGEARWADLVDLLEETRAIAP